MAEFKESTGEGEGVNEVLPTDAAAEDIAGGQESEGFLEQIIAAASTAIEGLKPGERGMESASAFETMKSRFAGAVSGFLKAATLTGLMTSLGSAAININMTINSLQDLTGNVDVSGVREEVGRLAIEGLNMTNLTNTNPELLNNITTYVLPEVINSVPDVLSFAV